MNIYETLPGPQLLSAWDLAVARSGFDAPDTARAQYYEEERVIELCVYENDQEEFVPRTTDGRCFRLSRYAADRLRKDLAGAIAEHDHAYRPRQEALL